jgi:chromate reductase
MTTRFKVAVIVGSLRKASHSRRVAGALMDLAPADLDCEFVEIGDLPLYTEDLDDAPPVAWTRFRDEVRRADAVLIVTPEYNRSVPGGLKNAIDVGSRPPFQSVWGGLPTAIVSSSPYKLGGFGANHHLRQSLVFLNMPAMPQPEAYLTEVTGMFDAEGGLTTPGREFLAQFIEAFGRWVARLRADDSPAEGARP